MVVDIPVVGLESYISNFKDIQFLRNKIIHAGSQFSNDSILEITKKYANSLHYDEETGFLKIKKPEVIENLVKLIREFYEEILWLLEEKREFQILKNILENWFGILNKQITINDISYKKTSKKIRTITFKVNLDDENFPQLNGKLILTHAKGYEVDIINQTDCDFIKNFVDAQMKSHGIYLEDELKVFLAFDKELDIKMLIY